MEKGDLNARIVELFDRTMLTYKVDDDGDIYISEGVSFPGWVRVSDDGRLIKIFTFVRFKNRENVDENAANKLVNRINSTYMPNSVYHEDGLLWSTYYLGCEDDFNEKNFISMLRRSFESFIMAVKELDEDSLVA